MQDTEGSHQHQLAEVLLWLPLFTVNDHQGDKLNCLMFITKFAVGMRSRTPREHTLSPHRQYNESKMHGYHKQVLSQL